MYLITGGSGFLGVNLVRYLLDRGHSVRVLDIASCDYPERGAVDVVTGDVRDPGAVARAAAGAEVVIHAAAALPLGKPEDIFSTDATGTFTVLSEAFNAGVSRVIFVSSTAVYGIPTDLPLYEWNAFHGVGSYGEAKILAERYCQVFRDRGQCVPVLRPKTFVGPERLGVFELLYEWAYQGRNFPVLGRGNNLYQLLDVEDLCEAIYLCATLDPWVVNTTFNVGARKFGTMRNNCQAVLDRAGHGKRVISLPALPAVLVLKTLEQLHLSPIYRWIYDTAGEDSFVSIDRLEKLLGFSPRYSNEEALIRNYDWYRLHRGEYKGKIGVSHRVPWNKGALQFAKHFF